METVRDTMPMVPVAGPVLADERIGSMDAPVASPSSASC